MGETNAFKENVYFRVRISTNTLMKVYIKTNLNNFLEISNALTTKKQ